MSYIGNEPIVSATRTVTEVTATAGQTVFTANGGYTVGYLDVFLNGAQLQNTDFTATNGSSVTLTEAAQVGDVVRLVAWGTFSTSNLVSPNYTGTLTGGTDVVNIGSGQVYKDASGKVGISTTSPLGKLEVKNGYSWFTAPSTDSAVIIHHDGTLGTVQTSYNSTGSYTPLTFKTSEVERMRIDSAGRVTKPYQPVFSATRTAGDVATSSTLIANTELINNGNHYNYTNGRFTAPVAGMYAFHVYFMSNASSNNDAISVAFYKNGVQYPNSVPYSRANGETYQGMAGHVIVPLNAGDYIEVKNTGSVGLYGQGTGHNAFSGYLIG
jgi:hypothetical protein